MTVFSLDPVAPNFLQPDKRTMHTLNTYMVLLDGRPHLLGGTPGGHATGACEWVVGGGGGMVQAVRKMLWRHRAMQN